MGTTGRRWRMGSLAVQHLSPQINPPPLRIHMAIPEVQSMKPGTINSATYPTTTKAAA